MKYFLVSDFLKSYYLMKNINDDRSKIHKADNNDQFNYRNTKLKAKKFANWSTFKLRLRSTTTSLYDVSIKSGRFSLSSKKMELATIEFELIIDLYRLCFIPPPFLLDRCLKTSFNWKLIKTALYCNKLQP